MQSMLRVRTLSLLSLAATVACSSGGNSPAPAANRTVAAFLADVRVPGATTERLATSPPQPSAAGPQAAAAGGASVINGGTSMVTLTGAASFDQVVVQVRDASEFYRINLATPATTAALLVLLTSQLPGNRFDMIYSVGRNGTFGAPATVPVAVTTVGTGDLQISVTWDARSDVDLHVVEPGGAEIYYASPMSGSGGVLDLDSNAGCAIDGTNNENVTWPTGRAPRGTYIVRVDYWSACSTNATQYTVRVNQPGMPPMVFQGTFNGPGDQGGLGSGTEIARFTR